jgi:SAM-dependent methyltransferase
MKKSVIMEGTNSDLVTYYAERAREYEKIYDKPERQSDLLALNDILQGQFAGKDVIELACGTGYWTQCIAKIANSVFATDINAPVIDVAKGKVFEKNNVTFELADLYTYQVSQPYNNLFAGFIWSHIKQQELSSFIDTVHRFVKPGGLVVFIDNNFVTESNRPIINTDEFGNTYQHRELENGKKYSIVKNFPTDDQFFKVLDGKAEGIKFVSLKYYWVVCYTRK